MNSEPIEPLRAPRVGPEVLQTRPAHPDERKDRRRERARTKARPLPPEEPEPDEAPLPPGGDDEAAEDPHKIDVYT